MDSVGRKEAQPHQLQGKKLENRRIRQTLLTRKNNRRTGLADQNLDSRSMG